MESHWNNPLFSLLYHVFSKLPFTRKLHQAIASCIEAGEEEVLAEVGSGTGAFIKILSERVNAEIIGIEPSKPMLKHSASLQTRTHVHLIRGVGEHIPLRKNSIDKALLVFSYHHLSDPSKTLQSLYMTVKDGGEVIVFEADPTIPPSQIGESYRKIGLRGPLAKLAHRYLKTTGHAVDPTAIVNQAKETLKTIEARIIRRIKGTPVSATIIKKPPTEKPHGRPN